MVHRVGDLFAAKIHEFAAWQTYEAGKNWAEAEADVAEAIEEKLRVELGLTEAEVTGEGPPGEQEAESGKAKATAKAS